MNRHHPSRRTLPALALLLACAALIGCPGSTRNLVNEGDALMNAGKHREAAATYKEALNTPGISGLDRSRAAIGEARAFFAMGDMVGATSRLRRMADSVSAKWYYLGRIDEKERRFEPARENYARALDKTHGGDTGERLALLVAAEAQEPARFEEAAAIAQRGGKRPLADGLTALAKVWRESELGHKAAGLLARFNAVVEGKPPAVPALPAVEVLRARLLSSAGKPADTAWNLEQAAPAPTDVFRAYAQERRASDARSRGDRAALARVLKDADPATARRIRAEAAAFSLARGDLEGALEILETAHPRKGGALAVRYMELIGRRADAKALWDTLGDETDEPAVTAVLRARAGDSLGAAAWLEQREVSERSGSATEGGGPSAPQPHLVGSERRAASLLLAAALARSALEGRARDEPDLSGWRAFSHYAPGDPLAGALDSGRESPVVGALAGASQRAWATAETLRALRLGSASKAARTISKAEVARVQVLIATGLRRALRQGDSKGVAALARKPAVRNPADPLLALELRASAGLSSVSARRPRGVSALRKVASGPWGSLVLPERGVRVPLVRALGEHWEEPSESRHPFAELDRAKAEFRNDAGVEADDPAPFPTAPRPVRAVRPLEIQ